MIGGKTGIRVIEAMTKKPFSISPESSIIEASKKMLEGDVGGLVVVDKGKAVGILTEQDLTKIIANKIDIENTGLKEVMSTKLIKIDPDDDIYDALIKMNKENVRRLPVMNKNNKLIGLLTIKDILVMQPTLIELGLEGMDIREREDKIKEGVCENCGSEGLLHNNDGKLLCRACSY